jgi:hypothetical protein
MSASRDERPYDHPDAHEVLPADLLKDAAELRAAGYDWMEVGAALGRNHYHLRMACRRDPRFEAEVATARREVLREVEAEMLRKAREHMRSEDQRVSAQAAERLAKYLTACRNCEARLQVEEVKTDAKLEAERIKAAATAAPEPRQEEGPPPRGRERDPVRAAVRVLREVRKLRREAPGGPTRAAPAGPRPLESAAAEPEWTKPGAPEG